MSPEQFESIKRYVGFDDESSRILADFLPVARPHFGAIVDDFYAAIQAHPEAHAAITGGQAQVDRLKRTLIKWLESVLGGPHDQAYLESHSRIGRVHVRINLPQEFMFTAMNRIRSQLLELTSSMLEPGDRRAAQTSIDRMLDLELAIMLDTYREDLVEKMTEERHRAVIERVPAFVMTLDHDGRILLWNRRLEEATGLAQEEMLGKDGEAYVGNAEEDVRLPLSGGGHRMVRWQRAQVERGDQAPVTYAVGVDVTDEREMQRRALRAERLAAVGTLAAGLAHEVRNPLNSGSLQLQVLERRIARGDTTADKLTPVVKLVHDEIRRLEALVSEFLSFARPTPMHLAPVSLNDLVSSVVDLVRPECQSAAIRIVDELDPDVGDVALDEERIRQVLLNIVRNAVEAMQDDGVLTVRTRAADHRGNVAIEIEDDGPGFPDGAPIFDAFYTTKEQGTGLGLAICHRIVQEHGGHIEVGSEPGRTCFTLTLPQPVME